MRKTVRLSPKNLLSKKSVFIGLATCIMLGLFLRGWKADTLMRFTGDEARDLAQARNITAAGILPVLGPKIYRGQGHLGPAYAYLLAIPLWASGYHPASTVFVVILLDLIAILLLFQLGREFFDETAALLAAFLYAISFAIIFYARWGWHPSLVPALGLFLLYGVSQVLKGRVGFWPFLSACQGLLLQLHLSAVLLCVPLVFALWATRRNLRWWNLFSCALALLLVSAPLLAFEVVSRFRNLRQILGLKGVLLGADGGGQSSLRFFTDIAQVIGDQAYWQYGERKILIDGCEILYWIIVSLVIAGFLYTGFALRKRPTLLLVFLMWVILPPLSLVGFDAQRSHYYMLLWFPLPILSVSTLLARALKWKAGPAICVLIMLVLVNLTSYSRYLQWLNQSSYDFFLAGPLWTKRLAVDTVVRDSGDSDFDLLVITWEWSNNRPYAYLFSCSSKQPNQFHALVAKPATGSRSHHVINTWSHYTPPSVGRSARTYILVEPPTLIELPGQQLLAANGHLAVYRASGSIFQLLRQKRNDWF